MQYFNKDKKEKHMKKILSISLLALLLASCREGPRYACSGDAETYTGINENNRQTNIQPTTVEKLVVHTFEWVPDKFIDVEHRPTFAKNAFSKSELAQAGWDEFRTSPPGIYLDRAVEVRKFHVERKVFDIYYEDLKKGYIYHYRGLCTWRG